MSPPDFIWILFAESDNLCHLTFAISVSPMIFGTTVKPGRYERYDGAQHTVVGVARHSETEEEFIVINEGAKLICMPTATFTESVQGPGSRLPRYRPI